MDELQKFINELKAEKEKAKIAGQGSQRFGRLGRRFDVGHTRRVQSRRCRDHNDDAGEL